MLQAVFPRGRVQELSHGPLRTMFGEFSLHVFTVAVPFVGPPGLDEHLALVRGDPQRWRQPLLCRVNSACLTSEVFGCQRCDCKWQLDQAMVAIAAAGEGVITYHVGHEGQGHGLAAKLRSYHLLDQGVGRSEVYQRMGLATEDIRDYRAAAAILAHLGVSSVVLLSNNARKAAALEACGITVAERRPLVYDGDASAIQGYLALKAQDPHQGLLKKALEAGR